MGAAGRVQAPTIARATSSRGASSSTKRSPVCVEQRRALAAHRLGDEEALAARDAGDGGGVELDELEVGERRRRPRGRAAGRSRTSRAGWWCATTARRRRRWRGSTARAASVRPSSSWTPATRPSSMRSARGARGPRARRCRGARRRRRESSRRIRRPGRAAARVHDAAARVPALEPEREVAVAVGVEARRRAARGRGSARAPPRPGCARPRRGRARGRRRSCPARCELGRVVDGERGGEPALGPVGRGLGQRAGGDERRRAAPSRAARQRGEEPGGAGAHDDEVGPVHGDGAPYGIRVSRHPSGCATTLSLAHDVPGPSRAAGADRRARGARWSAHDWFGCDAACDAPGRDARRSCTRSTRPRTSTSSRSCAPPAAGTIDCDTVAVPATYEAALRAAGGAVALVDALLGGRRRRPGSPRCARPGTTPSRRGRWASASSATSRSRRGARASAHGARAGADRRLGRPPRQRDQRDLPRGPGRAVRLDPRVAAVSGDRAGARSGVGRRARATRSTCRCRRASGDETYRSLVEHVVVPLIAGVGAASSCSSRRASTPIALDPLATCRVTERGLRGDDGVAAAGVRCGRARRSGWCSRAATRSRR